jgi:flagellar FliL protein
MNNVRWLTVVACVVLLNWNGVAAASGGGSEDPDPKGTKYFELAPSLTTNYNRDDGKVGFLSVGVQLKIKGAANVEKVKPHSPLLLDAIVWLIRSQSMEQVKSLEARETLRKEALTQINEKLKTAAKTKKDLVEDVLFTKYVWQ